MIEEKEISEKKEEEEEEVEALDVFLNVIANDKKYYSWSFPEKKVNKEDIEKAIQLLMNEYGINDYLRRLKKFEDNRIARYESNHCKICNKAYANVGITTPDYFDSEKEEMVWYCSDHSAYGSLIAIENKINHKEDSEKNINELYKIVKRIAEVMSDHLLEIYKKAE